MVEKSEWGDINPSFLFQTVQTQPMIEQLMKRITIAWTYHSYLIAMLLLYGGIIVAKIFAH